MIEFGKFSFNNCTIEKYEASKFTHSKFNGGKTSYNLIVKKTYQKEEEEFFIIANNLEGFDIVEAQRYKKPCSIEGTILKNPATHKILYVVNQAGLIKLED